jgi:hypothetical protein
VLGRNHHQPSSVRSPENIDTVRVAVQRSSSKSTRKAAAQLGISRRSVQQILKSDLSFYPYNITVLPNFQFKTNIKGWHFSEWAHNNEVLFISVQFYDETHFHLDGVVNKQNV